MPLSKLVLDQLVRLGAPEPPAASAAAIEFLNEQVEYPKGDFYSSVARYRELLRQSGVTRFDDSTDEELTDEMPLIWRLQFVQSDDWDLDYENDFVGVKPGQVFFANDENKYFFLVENLDDPDDPLVLQVDHEDVSDEPSPIADNITMTLSQLLSLLESRQLDSNRYDDTDAESAIEDNSSFWVDANKNMLLQRVIEYFEDEIDEEYDGEEELVRYVKEFIQEQTADEIEAFYDGVEFGDQIASRINEIRAVSTSRFHEPEYPLRVEAEQAQSLVESMVSSVRALALECGSTELDKIFSATRFVRRSIEDDLGDRRRSKLAHSMLIEMARSVLSSPTDHDAAAAVIRSGLESYLLPNWNLLAYIQWPIYESAYKTKDPFKPFFELWARRIDWNLDYDDPNVIEFVVLSE